MAENRDANESTPSHELLVRCAWCERIKMGDDWVDAEVHAMRLTRDAIIARHSHGICPDCFAKLTPPGRP